MLVELKSKSQVTMPKKIVDSLGLEIGDKFEVSVEDGKVIFEPVVIYPESITNEIKNTIAETIEAYNKGEIPSFDSFDELIEHLENNEI